MQIERVNSETRVENKLPDGSRIIVDSASETVFALNATAGAAWDACSAPTTLSNITEKMQSSLGSEVTEDLAYEAIVHLQESRLVTTSELPARTSRRRMIGAAAAAMVVSLAVTEQKARAMLIHSKP